MFASLSARVGSIGDNRLGGWISYRAAKAAQNQILRSAAIEIARKRPGAIVVALHPGTVATPLTARYAGGHPTVAPETAAANLLAVLDGLTPADTGGFFAWDGQPDPRGEPAPRPRSRRPAHADALGAARRRPARDVVVMAEVADEATYVSHHVKKIAFLFAAMRKFAERLEADGWRVDYARLDDPATAASIPASSLRRAAETGASEVIATECGEWRLRQALDACPLRHRPSCPTTASSPAHADFAAWADGRQAAAAWSSSTARCGARPAC